MSRVDALNGLVKLIEGNEPSSVRADRRQTVAAEDIMFRFKQRCFAMGCSPVMTKILLQNGYEDAEKARSVVESPIEDIMVMPLVFADWFGFYAAPVPVYLEGSSAPAPDSDILIIPQMKFMRFRADFGIVCQAGDARKIFFVECDGNEFHQDVAHDLERDRYLKALGVTLIRLTGSEINASPAAALQRVVFVITAWKDAQKAVAA